MSINDLSKTLSFPAGFSAQKHQTVLAVPHGGSGQDTINGSSGDDLIYGNQGADYLAGGDGNDTIYGGQNDGPATLDVLGLLRMQEGTETIDGGADNDLIYGQYGNERLNGSKGEDTIYGGQGEDSLFGKNGDDHLFGNRDDDLLSGGSGHDYFYFGGDFGNDLVTDFEMTIDIAIVSGDINFTSTAGGNTIFEFANGSSIEFTGVIMNSSDLVFV